MAIFGKITRALGLTAAPETVAGKPAPAASYMRGGRSVTMAGWRPVLRETQDDISAAWDQAAARATDMIHNSAWLSGMIDHAVAMTVGTGLRLLPKPENSLFGMSDDAARAWAKMVASRWEAYARSPQECDITGLRNFGQLQAAAYRSWIPTGEILAELPWRRRAWNRYGTKVRLLAPHRLSRKSDMMQRLINGVFTDADGMPVGYLATRRDQVLGTVEYRVSARDAAGRARVIHVFDGLPETYRGISVMVSCLQVARQFDQLSDSVLTQNLVRTMFAATIRGDAPTEEILEGILTPQERARMMSSGVSPFEAYMDMMGGYYDAATINVGVNGRVAHMFPGQEMTFHTADLPGSDYEAYSQHLLREICRCLGLTYTGGTGDYRGATYSSTRMETTINHEVVAYRRKNVVAPFCQAVYESWLEEEIAEHGLPFPGGYDGFLANRVAACRAEWRGSAKPQADDLKTAKAHEIWKRLGVMSDEMIASDLGVDIEDVYAARANEAELRQKYDLPDAQMMGASGGAPEPAGGSPEDDPEDDNEGAAN